MCRRCRFLLWACRIRLLFREAFWLPYGMLRMFLILFAACHGNADMPEPTIPALTPQQHKALRNRHPLYKRLSGEGVWVFLEELGLDEGQCERFMDAFFFQMDQILSRMAALDAHPHWQGRIAGRPEDCCPACAARIGRYVRSEDVAGARALLPPYGIGCPLSLYLAPAPDAPPSPDAALLSEAPGGHSVLCARLATNPEDGLRRFLAAMQAAAPAP